MEKSIDPNSSLNKAHKITSTYGKSQINKLHKSLTLLEERCNEKIASNYLIGFLEDKGMATFEEFIRSLK